MTARAFPLVPPRVPTAAARPTGPRAVRAQAPVINLSGDLDGAAITDSHAQIAPVLAAGVSVLVDLSRVTFFGSEACRMLVQLNVEAIASGATIHVERPTPVVRRVLEATGLAWLLTPDEDARD